MAMRKCSERIMGAPLTAGFSILMSTTRTSGSRRSSTRCGRVTSWYLPVWVLRQLSRLGVALPSRTAQPSRWARMTATSRP